MRTTASRIALVGASAAVSLLSVATAAGAAVERRAAAPVVTVVSGGAAIPTLRTARGVTTMVTLPEEAREAVCGDLYDAQNGFGGYVIQRSGRDLFLKPLRSAAGSNLFVKTDRATYAFELVVVAPALAMRIVRVAPAAAAPDPTADDRTALERERTALAAERATFERERADAATDLDRRRAELEHAAEGRAESLARTWLADAVRRGTAVSTPSKRTAHGRDVDITLGEALVQAGGRGYLACAVRNRSRAPVTLAEVEVSGVRRPIAVVISPGQASVVVLETPVPVARNARVRLLDPSGADLVSIAPFR